MAFVSIFLVLLAFGIVDIGRAIFSGISVEEAAQEGAAFAAFTDQVAGATVTADQIKARVVSAVSQPVIDPNRISVSCQTDPRPKKDGTRVTVAVAHQVTLLTPFMGRFFGGPLTINKTSTAERFFADCPTGSTP
jgi:Flp pilus assembly protein TadG